MLLGLYPPG
jgi:hypothetical protein